MRVESNGHDMELVLGALKSLTEKVDTISGRQSDVLLQLNSVQNALDMSVSPRLDGLYKKTDKLELCINGNGKKGLDDRLKDVEGSVHRIGNQVRDHDRDLNDPEKGIKTFVLEKKIAMRYIVLVGSITGSVASIIATLLTSPLIQWLGQAFHSTPK